MQRRDGLHGVGAPQGLSARLGQAEVLDLARADQILDRARHVLDRHRGIDAVLETEHFAALAKANPVNAETLRRLGADAFATAMRRWLAGFVADRDYPVAGLSPEAVRAITLPAIVIPGNDKVHPPGPAQAAHRMLGGSVYEEVLTQQVDADVDFAGWERATGTLAARFINFLRSQER